MLLLVIEDFDDLSFVVLCFLVWFLEDGIRSVPSSRKSLESGEKKRVFSPVRSWESGKIIDGVEGGGMGVPGKEMSNVLELRGESM